MPSATFSLLPRRRLCAFVNSALLSCALFSAGCASPSGSRDPISAVTTREAQQAMTPDQAIAWLSAGNDRFVSGQSIHRDLPAQVKETGAGQFPFAVVLSCIDSRTTPEYIFDQGIGDIFVPRIAGNYAPMELLGSMEFATKVAGARAVVVLGHTGCGAIKGACDDVQLGNLTAVIQALQPAVVEVPGFANQRTSSNTAFVNAVTEANVRLTVQNIRTNSPIMRELEDSGRIWIVGAMYDISTGEVRWLER